MKLWAKNWSVQQNEQHITENVHINRKHNFEEAMEMNKCNTKDNAKPGEMKMNKCKTKVLGTRKFELNCLSNKRAYA